MSEVPRASAWLDGFAARAKLPGALVSRLQVALDEMFTNVLYHGLAGVPVGSRRIDLRAHRAAGRVVVELIDDGPAFDPTQAVIGCAETRVTERRPGGVGLLFVRTLIDEVRFVRQDGRNRLTMVMHLPEDAEEEG